MTPRDRPLKRLDPTWWSKRPDGYDQQNGRARLVRVKEGTKVVGWALYVDNEWRGRWSSFGQAKQGAAELSALWDRQPDRQL